MIKKFGEVVLRIDKDVKNSFNSLINVFSLSNCQIR